MSQSTKSVSPLRQRMIEDMTLRKLSPATQTGYLRAVVRLSKYLGRSPDTATAEELRLFQLHLAESGVFMETIHGELFPLNGAQIETGRLPTVGSAAKAKPETRMAATKISLFMYPLHKR